MYFYIRDKNSFVLKAASIGFDYEIVNDSIFDDNSNVIIKYDSNIKCGDIITNNRGYYGVISEIEKGEGDTLELTCENIISLFNREIIYSPSSANSLEARLKDYIDSEFTNNTDNFFKISYLNVTTGSSTISDLIPEINNGTYNLMEFIGKARIMNNVMLEFTANGNTLNINIVKKQMPTKNVIIDNMPCTIEEETFSDELISKIICYNEESSVITNYYLLSDKNITTNASDPNRVEGKCEIINVSADDDTYSVAYERFKENEYSHKIVFSVPEELARYNFYDRVIIQMNQKIYSSYIASKIFSSDGLVTYQCGELQTTLTDKMRSVIGYKKIPSVSQNSVNVASITSDDIEDMWN